MIDDLLAEIRDRAAQKRQRVLVTTLTKRMSEDLANYYTESRRPLPLHALRDRNPRAHQAPSATSAKGEYDVLIGINLLREGLDLPEVSFVANSRTPTRKASSAPRAH